MDIPSMPTVDREEEKTVEETEKELQQMYASMIYKTTATRIGETANTAKNNLVHGKSSRFSAPLSQSGMFRSTGLNTCVEREKVFDGSRDWMDKI